MQPFANDVEPIRYLVVYVEIVPLPICSFEPARSHIGITSAAHGIALSLPK